METTASPVLTRWKYLVPRRQWTAVVPKDLLFMSRPQFYCQAFPQVPQLRPPCLRRLPACTCVSMALNNKRKRSSGFKLVVARRKMQQALDQKAQCYSCSTPPTPTPSKTQTRTEWCFFQGFLDSWVAPRSVIRGISALGLICGLCKNLISVGFAGLQEVLGLE